MDDVLFGMSDVCVPLFCVHALLKRPLMESLYEKMLLIFSPGLFIRSLHGSRNSYASGGSESKRERERERERERLT